MKKSIIEGLVWNILSLFASKGFGFVVQIVLARLLLPEHFGIVGMTVVFTNVIMVLGELGLAAALIQMKESKLENLHLSTAFLASIGINLILYLITVALIAPFAVWFYDEPILLSIISVTSIQIILKSIIVIPRVLLTRELDFKRINIIEIISFFIAGVSALLLAWKGAGVWSIVFMGLTNSLVSLPLFWSTVKWRPNLEFSKKAFNEIFQNGVFDTLQRVFMSLTSNIDYLFIGKMVSAVSLGFYTLAFVITDTFRQQIMSVLNKVLFPVFGKLQEDKVKIKKYYLKVVKLNCYFITPVMLVMIGFTEPIIVLLVGEEWLKAAFPIKAMAFSSIVHSVGGGTDAVLKGLGKFKLNFKVYSLKTLFITIPAFYIGIYYYGINGAAVAVVLHKFISRVIFQILMKRIVLISELELFRAVVPAAIGASASVTLILYYYYANIKDMFFTVVFIILSLLVYFLFSFRLISKEFKNIFEGKIQLSN